MATEHLPGQLDLEDFIKMDVTRPLVPNEIAEILPQAVLDRSELEQREHDQVPASYEHEPESGPVDAEKATTYPYEEPLGPNVHILPAETTHDLTPEEILRAAYDAKLTDLVIVGIDAEGREVILRTSADSAEAVWHLQRGLYNLNIEFDKRHYGEKA